MVLVMECDWHILVQPNCHEDYVILRNIGSSCCRKDLPDKCLYGDKLGSCSAIGWSQCTNPDQETSSLCCETCYNLIVSILTMNISYGY